MFRFRDRILAEKIIKKLKDMKLNIRIMHVCGTHQDTIVRYGLDELLRQCGVEVRQGPGCPVCITTAKEFCEAITLARNGKVVVTYGDVAKAPSKIGSLLDQRAEGCDVRIVYSVEDAVRIAKETSYDVVFMAVGFETTAPSTAEVLLEEPPENFFVLSCHRYIPPALHALLKMGELKLDGLIEPGHVSTIIGVKPYEEISRIYGIPQVIAGFEPLDLLMAVYMLAHQIKHGEVKVENEYTRSVKYEGNLKALKILEEVFEPFDAAWRGFPVISKSGMKIRKKFEEHDARKSFQDILEKMDEKFFEEPEGCRCGEILRGLVNPEDCPLFGNVCTPNRPVGPCMVSVEGACNIQFKYGKGKFSG
ncbi:hydrogenase formation protein HypD [Candidatus Bathyarchaeota archaeon]|nr:MAG: hydrogenase formation protein HypD [Candidatus Bathyarchaeota archaeon]